MWAIVVETPPDGEVPLQRRVELELLGALGTVEGLHAVGENLIQGCQMKNI